MTLKHGYGFQGLSGTPPSKSNLSTPPPVSAPVLCFTCRVVILAIMLIKDNRYCSLQQKNNRLSDITRGQRSPTKGERVRRASLDFRKDTCTCYSTRGNFNNKG